MMSRHEMTIAALGCSRLTLHNVNHYAFIQKNKSFFEN